jgi:hypothetical protein
MAQHEVLPGPSVCLDQGAHVDRRRAPAGRPPWWRRAAPRRPRGGDDASQEVLRLLDPEEHLAGSDHVLGRVEDVLPGGVDVLRAPLQRVVLVDG